ncbi:WD repeat-containing protein 17-like 1, partial [Homarus americanus]
VKLVAIPDTSPDDGHRVKLVAIQTQVKLVAIPDTRVSYQQQTQVKLVAIRQVKLVAIPDTGQASGIPDTGSSSSQTQVSWAIQTQSQARTTVKLVTTRHRVKLVTTDNSCAWNVLGNANYLQSADSYGVLGGLNTATRTDRHLSSGIRGGMLQQLSLLAAGAQPWHHNICTAHYRRFAYAATLAIYVYEVESGSNQWQLCSILADHRKTITCLDWHPCSDDLLASASLDQRVCVWSVSRQCVLHAISICRVPIVVAWCTGHRDLLSFTTQTGPIQLWDYTDTTEPYPVREDYGYTHAIITYRWHPTVPGRLAIGHDDGKITVYREDIGKSRYSALPEGGEDNDDHNLVTLEWDACSPDYILVAYKGGALWLVDVNTMRIVTKYIMPLSASVSTLAWLPDAPGMFITGVNKPTPIENNVLKDTGFHVLCVTQVKAANKNALDLQNDAIGDRRAGLMIPNVNVVSLFKDGGVGLYHLRRKQWIFHREHGHTETIFDCSFKPEDSDLLATSSFDGSIKIWRIDTMETVDTLPNCHTIIYSLSWAPADLNCIVAGTSSGGVFIWDVNKHKVLQDICCHKDKKVFCVAWNHKDARRIASAGESGFCYIHQVSGTQVQEYRHPGPVYGCDWRDADILATGCEDGKIRVFNVAKNRKEPVTELKAHLKKVFRVKWNPVYHDILCSGSDDSSVRIWSYSKAQCLTILVGHSDNVRGLAWCPEVPFLLISGSWDRTLRVWDARNACCLDVVLDHGADVYGLTIHPVRPFLLASCSRDSTTRLWSLASFVAPLQLKVLAGRPLADIIENTGNQQSFSPGLHLCGLRAAHLQMTLNKTDALHHPAKTIKLFADLFCATAAEQELEANRGHGVAGRKHSTTEGQEVLAEAYLKCGAIQQYCYLDKAFSQCVALSKISRKSSKGPPPEVPPRVPAAEVNGTAHIQDRMLECARLRESLYAYAGFPSSAECSQKAVGPVLDQVLYLLLSAQPHKGLTMGLEFLQEQIIGENLDQSSVWYVLRLVQAVPLTQTDGKWVIRGDQRGGLLALSAYLGAVRAAVLNYTSVVPHLLSHARCGVESVIESCVESIIKSCVESVIESCGEFS